MESCILKECEYTDPVAVCHKSDLQENEMRQVEVHGSTSILLVKQNDILRAVGAHCPHRGAPLSKGVLSRNRVRCPWHGACFNLETGDIENFPGLDSLPCHQVEVDSRGQVLVRVKRTDLRKKQVIKKMVRRNWQDQRCFVVVGGGPSGAVCVETLRQEGFTGRVILVCREQHLPYDRIEIMNSSNQSANHLYLRNDKFYRDYDIEVCLGVSAEKVDTFRSILHCSNGKRLHYDKLYIATGYSAIRPDIPGVNLENVRTIRDIGEARSILKLVGKATQVVCLGSSFMAVEAAAHLVSKAASVTLVARQNVPFKTTLGDLIGRRILQLLGDNNVKLRMSSGITQILGNYRGEVTAVQLLDRTRIPCDLLILGTGCRCNTHFLQHSGVEIHPNGSVDVNDFLQTNVRNVYAGGDITNAHILGGTSDRVNISHYGLAQYHGRTAAMNMCGHIARLEAVPFFYTVIFGKAFRSAGFGPYKDVIIDGSLEDLQFAAYFVDHRDKVTSVASCGRDPIVAQFAELIAQKKGLCRCQIANFKSNWIKKLMN
ncbi:apoptosis-inducing factor 3 [Drosophila biarmipes]|uniref:apoptosis-inducing factor 3 n=1 Tax=Drosophila biarmipes TaxID=125945 RepID=UPI0007E78D8F|nr:apoptosis-inducing factor 3 [Drosophila biarmipes]XP_043950246.1 apoptosis-inducing factor 3 [Drosophila biarmipes]